MTDVVALAKEACACSACGGGGMVPFTRPEHDPGCDGSCRNCPVPVEDWDPCVCVDEQATISVGLLRALVERVETDRHRLRAAVNARCSCGGSGPDDPGCCEACKVWHLATGGHDG